MIAVKKGDRFRVNDVNRGTRWGTIQADADDTQPVWPMVAVLFDEPGETPYMEDVQKLTLLPK